MKKLKVSYTKVGFAVVMVLCVSTYAWLHLRFPVYSERQVTNIIERDIPIGTSQVNVIKFLNTLKKKGVYYEGTNISTDVAVYFPETMLVMRGWQCVSAQLTFKNGKIINRIADETDGELSNDEIHDAFEREYLQREEPLKLVKFRAISTKDDKVECHAQVIWKGEDKEIRSRGNGPIDAFVVALREHQIADFDIANFNQHSLEGGAEARAVCYIQIRRPDKSTFYGAAIDTNIELASIKAVVSAVNRALGE